MAGGVEIHKFKLCVGEVGNNMYLFTPKNTDIQWTSVKHTANPYAVKHQANSYAGTAAAAFEILKQTSDELRAAKRASSHNASSTGENIYGKTGGAIAQEPNDPDLV